MDATSLRLEHLPGQEVAGAGRVDDGRRRGPSADGKDFARTGQLVSVRLIFLPGFVELRVPGMRHAVITQQAHLVYVFTTRRQETAM